MDKKIKVLIIDPWYIRYSQEMINHLSRLIDVSLATRYNISIANGEFTVFNVFFRISDKIKKGPLRKIIRLLEYVHAWRRILCIIKHNSFNVIHIQWLLHYKTDIFFLDKIKKFTISKKIKLVYTAHNDMPHVNGQKSIEILKKIYNSFDTIIVHGNDTKEKIQHISPNLKNFYLQKFGAYTSEEKMSIKKDRIKTDHYERIEGCKGIKLLLFGNIYRNKGFDRIMRYWCMNKSKLSNHLLIIAGSLHEADSSYKLLAEEIDILDNVIYYTEYINNDEHDYFFRSADLIIVPYRHASMSAVIFTAVQYYKTVLATKVGCIPDYINSENAFLVENDDNSIYQCLDEIINTPKSKLKEMGNKLNKEICRNFDWGNICEKLIKDVYES